MRRRVMVALAAGLAWPGPAFAEGEIEMSPHICAPVVDRKLDELKVDRADLAQIIFSPRYETRDDENRMTGTDVWARYKTCRGSLVIDLERDCRVRQVYTRGQCRIPGIKAF